MATQQTRPSVGNTAIGAAVCRLIEQYQPDNLRLFNDPLVKDMVGGVIGFLAQFRGMRTFILNQTEGVAKGLYGTQICRTRFIDDGVQTALSQGIDQVVILGAGLDTRAYRLPGIERAKVFEVDLPSVQSGKKKKLEKHLGHVPDNVTFLPIDFATQTLDDIFAGTKLDRAKPVIYIWEAVTQYLSEDAVRKTLTFIGSSAPGSILLMTYVLKSVIERRSDIPDANRMMDSVAKTGAPWTFGLDPATIQDYLKPFHLSVMADVGNADYQEKYLRPIKRDLAVTEAERIVQARITSA